MVEPLPPAVAATAKHRCMLCAGTTFTDLVVPDRCTMRRCERCGFWVNADFEPEGDWSAHYGEGYQEGLYGRPAARKLRSASYAVRCLEALGGRGRLLDVGCSLGYVVAAAQARGLEAYGVDISHDAVEYCRRQGLDVRPGDMRHLPFADGFFDLVHARHVLEHDLEVYQSLAEMRRVLSPGGLLLLEVPDGEAPKVRRRGASYTKFWWPEHAVCFTPSTLAVFMARAGFAPVAAPLLAGAGNAGPAGVLPFVLWRLTHALREGLGEATYINGLWRKAGPPAWDRPYTDAVSAAPAPPRRTC